MTDAEAPKPSCPDCRVEMELGWQPDFAYRQFAQASWQPGIPKHDWMFGYHVTGKAIPVTVWRCPQCFLLRHYAIASQKKWRKVD